jgi:hypothetical protein
VDESAVMTVHAFSSALAAEARLTTPRAARATVHLLNFISSSDPLSVLFLFSLHLNKRVKPVYPRTKTGAFAGTHRENHFD